MCSINWSSGTPGTNDTVIFDSTSVKNASISSALSIQRMEVRSGYTGTITQSAVFRTGSFTQSGGTFAGGSNAIAISGEFVQKAGTFQSTSGTFSLSGSLTLLGNPTFQNNNGTIRLNGATDQTLRSSGSIFWNITLDNTGGGSVDDIVVVGGGLFLSGALTVNQGNLDLSTNSQPLVVDRGITLADASQATLTTNSNVTASGTILVNDSASLTVTGGTWTLNDDGDQSVDFDGQALSGVTLLLANGATASVRGGMLDVNGNLIMSTGILAMSGHTLDLEGNLTTANSSNAGFTASGTLTIAGNIT
ncbi:MAG: hypothetical protein AAB855_02400, partial [Patescibacteria group bacterium]